MSSARQTHPLLASTLPQSLFYRGRPRSRRVGATILVVVTIHIPLRYNANAKGMRKPVEQSKIDKTLHEVQAYFDGFSLLSVTGWYRSEEPRGTWDDHIRIEIDSLCTVARMRWLSRWTGLLAIRFKQKAIYMRVSGPAYWL
jgi:hypothetical protein